MEKQKTFVVIGMGTFGIEVCRVLMEKGGKVIAVDKQSQLIDKVKDMVTQAFILDATDESALANIPFEEVDYGIIAIGDNVEANILTTTLIKRIGVPYIVARSVSNIHSRVLTQVGASQIVNVEIDGAHRLAVQLVSPQLLERLALSSSISVAEIQAPKMFFQKPLRSLDLRAQYHMNIIAIKRVHFTVDETGNPIEREEVIFPDGETVIQERDLLVVVGKDKEIDVLQE